MNKLLCCAPQMLSVEDFVIWADEIPGKEGKKNQLTNQQMQ